MMVLMSERAASFTDIPFSGSCWAARKLADMTYLPTALTVIGDYGTMLFLGFTRDSDSVLDDDILEIIKI